MSGSANGHEATECEVFAVLMDALGQLQTLVWMTTMLAYRQTEERFSLIILHGPESYPTGTMDTNPATSLACEYRKLQPIHVTV